MKRILLFASVLFSLAGFSQSDNCSSATPISVTANCGAPVNGTTAGATQTIPGCAGTADDDVWYSFVATATSHQINVTGSASFDAVVELFSSGCGTLISLSCMDNTFSGQTETINATGLTIGNTYHIRVYNYGVGSGSSTFTICVTNPPPAPVNNSCFSPTSLTVNTSCTYTAGTSVGATQSYAGCSGTADDDVWYTFVANSSVMTITVDPSTNMDAVVELYSGTCGAFTSLSCMDVGFTNGNETINANGLSIGATYYVKVYDYYSGSGYPFQICVTGTPPSGSPVNDAPCNAIALPPITAICNYSTFSNVGATETASPVPSSCAGGSGAMDGGFSTSTIADVWFSIVVPASGVLAITAEPNISAGWINDGTMALYSGTCGALSQIACSDDNNYPGGSYDLLPFIKATGLTPGTTVYLRYWGYGGLQGNFGFCVTSVSNDECTTALYICDLNGYGASTKGYTKGTFPVAGNMYGNNQSATTGIKQVTGTNTGGLFGTNLNGQNGSAAGVSAYDVTIDNNSWIRFTAANTTVILNVTVSDCWNGGGVQMQIFSTANCNTYTVVSDFHESTTGFTLTAPGLTVGQDYYLEIDGFGGDLCNYVISANAGVQFPAITATANSVCYGGPVTLTAPAGASSYEWFPNGQATQAITVNPYTTTTYTCVVGGVCGNKQTLTKQIVVNPLPTVLINSGNPVSVCNTSSVTLTASGAFSYSWNTGPTTSTVSVSPVTNTTYTVTGTDINGCVNTATTTVNVLSLPTIAVNSATICFNQGATLTATGGSGSTSYNWSNGTNNINTISVNPASTTNYTVTGTGANGCTNVATSTVTVNSLPNITVSSTTATVCNGQPSTLTASGAASTSSYTWSNGALNTNTVTVNPASNTTYTVTGTAANTCTATATITVNVNQLPNVTVNNLTLCANQSGNLTANGGTSYSWNTGASGPVISIVNPVSSTSYTVTGTDGNNCSNTAVANLTVNAIPQVTSAPTITQSNCGTNTGAITGVTASGSGALNYSWTNSSNVVVGTTANISNIPAGTYNLTITDANGCDNVFSYSVTNPGAPVAPSASALPSVVCAGDSIVLSAGTIGGATYQWTGPNGFSSSQQNVSILNSVTANAGTYSVTATVTNCTGPAGTVSIVVNPLPIATASSQSSSYCTGNTISLFGSGGNSYSWSGPNGYTSSSQNPQLPNSTINMSGTYSLTVTDANGCKRNDTALVLVNVTPVISSVSASPSAVICAGQNITLNASAGGSPSYQWTGPNAYSSSQQNPTLNNVNVFYSGTYSVVVTASGNCIDTAQVNVVVNALPNANALASSPAYCSGSTISLSGGGGGGTYSWTGPNGYTSSSQNPQITNSAVNMSGTYILVVTDANNCQNSDTVQLSVNPTPLILSVSALPDTVVCEGQNINLNAATTGTPTYQWTGPNGFSSAQQNISFTNVTTAESGVYSLTATENNCAGAVSSVSVTVNQLPTAAASAVQQTLCAGGNLQLNGTGGSAYDWSGPGGFTDTNQNPSLNPVQASASGTYTLSVTDVNGCSDTSQLNIVVNALPTANANASSSVYCSGSTVNLFGAGGGTYNWTGPNGFSSSQQNPVIPNSTIISSGIYTVTVTDNNNCSNSDTVNVQINQAPVVSNAVSDSSCNGAALNLSVTTTSGVLNWYSDAALTQLAGSGTNFSPVGLVIDSMYTFYVQASNNGCLSNVTSVTAISHSVNASFTPSVSQGIPPLSAAFTNTSTGLNVSATTVWDFNDGTTDLNYNSTHIFNLPGSYNVMLIVTNTQNGCIDTATATIIVTDEITVSIPNIFTPNGDGVNDLFEIHVEGAKEVEGWIMNRWGQIMFTWSGPNASWDGKGLNGQNASDATYFYLVKATSFSNKKEEFKGYLLLVR